AVLQHALRREESPEQGRGRPDVDGLPLGDDRPLHHGAVPVQPGPAGPYRDGVHRQLAVRGERCPHRGTAVLRLTAGFLAVPGRLAQADARSWNSTMALHAPRPMPLAICGSSTMLCARKIRTELSPGSACHQPPYAPGHPTVPTPPRHVNGSALPGSITTATPMPYPWPAANTDRPSIRAVRRWSDVSWFEAIKAHVSGRSRRTPSTSPRPRKRRAKAR